MKQPPTRTNRRISATRRSASDGAAPKHKRAETTTPRWRKLQRLGQAHLAPGMSLQRWRDLLDLYDIGELFDAPDKRIDGLIAEISEIVRLAKAGSEHEIEERKL